MGKLLLLFIIVPAVELALLIRIGVYFGTLPTVALIIFTGVLGAYLARLQGLSVLARAQEQMSRGELPTGSLADGVMILVAGALLMTPGILTDTFGFLLLVPAFRARVKNFALARYRRAVDENRVQVHVNMSGFGIPGDEGPVIDIEPDRLGPEDSEPPKYKVH